MELSSNTRIIFDRDTHMMRDIPMVKEELSEDQVESVCDFIKKLNSPEVELSGIGEPSLRALRKALRRRRAKDDPTNNTYIPEIDECDMVSYGAIEATVRWWQLRAQTYRCDVEETYGMTLKKRNALLAKAKGHAAFVTNAYRRKG